MRRAELILGGIGDEAGVSLRDQIAAHHDLGWRHMELRSIDAVPLAELAPARDGDIADLLSDNGIVVPVLCSRIGNWESTVGGDIGRDCDELGRLIALADYLGSRFIRIMSYRDDGRDPQAWADDVKRRIGMLVQMAERAGQVLLLENCAGWAGASASRILDLIRSADSSALRVLFDIGNPVAYGYDGVAFLNAVVPHVAHVHVKDAMRRSGDTVFCAPGAGDARLRECVEILMRAGYGGMWSIEPHLKLIPHQHVFASADELRASYVAYGRAVEALLDTMLPDTHEGES